MEFRFGLISPNMKVIGSQTKLMGLVNFIMLMGMFMRDNGKMIKLMDRVNTLMPMEQSTMVIGLMINNMDMELNHGQMVLGTKENTLMERKKARVHSTLLMDLCLLVTLKVMRSTDSVLMNGLMERNTKVIGLITRCVGREP